MMRSREVRAGKRADNSAEIVGCRVTSAPRTRLGARKSDDVFVSAHDFDFQLGDGSTDYRTIANRAFLGTYRSVGREACETQRREACDFRRVSREIRGATLGG